MATLQFRWEGNGIARITAAANTLAGPQKNVALRRALNHTGRKVFTQVKRELGRQIGAPTTRDCPLWQAQASGGQQWATAEHHRRERRPNSFEILPRPTDQSRCVGKSLAQRQDLSRRVYHRFRTTFFLAKGRRFPSERVASPNVPKGMIKDATAVAFNTVTATSLPSRVEHEVRAIPKGVLSGAQRVPFPTFPHMRCGGGPAIERF
jgi:hypothetical protein